MNEEREIKELKKRVKELENKVQNLEEYMVQSLKGNITLPWLKEKVQATAIVTGGLTAVFMFIERYIIKFFK